MRIGRVSLVLYRSAVWWGWFNAQHVTLRWGMLYIGRIGLGWQVR